MYNLKDIIKLAKDRFVMNVNGIHGIEHWERVRQNGLMIADDTGADKNIIELFAFLHDCCRENDAIDPDHGKKAAHYAETLRGKHIFLDDAEFNLFADACKYHTAGRTEADITVMACWDADRLDLWRVGIRPHPKHLCTSFAKNPDIIEQCCQNSIKNKEIV